MEKEVIILVGIQGSGKTSLAKNLKEKDQYNHIEMGEILRQYIEYDGSEYSKEDIQKGLLAPDSLVNSLLSKRIELHDKIVLDGYPRTLDQHCTLLNILGKYKNNLKLTYVHLSINQNLAMSRCLSRGRPDDTSDALDHRFHSFNMFTLPILSKLKSALVIHQDESSTIENIYKQFKKSQEEK